MKQMLLLFTICALIFCTTLYGQMHNTAGKSSIGRSPTSILADTLVPNKVSYQGVLTTAAGSPATDGSYSLTFEVFDQSAGGSALWNETQTGVSVQKGTFSVLLGSVQPLPQIFYKPLWLQVTAVAGPGISSSIVFSPRSELASVPYALGPWLRDSVGFYLHGSFAGIGAPPGDFFGGPAEGLDIKLTGRAIVRTKLLPGGSNYVTGFWADKSSVTDNNYLVLQTDGVDRWSLGTMGSDDFSLFYWPSYRYDLYVSTLGNVGIGTNAPQVKLDVNGKTHVRDSLMVGSPTNDGDIFSYLNGSANPVTHIYQDRGNGGAIDFMDEVGNRIGEFQPDFNGTGGYFSIYRTIGISGFYVDGNYNGTLQPLVGINGSNRSAIFNMNATGNSSVVLPDSSISAAEILDEPGIAEQNTSSTTGVSGTTMVDVDTLSITIPAPGYIVVQAKTNAYFTGTLNEKEILAQIDETPGGTIVSPYWVRVGLSGYSSTGGYSIFPVFVTRTYYKSSPGKYSFRLEAAEDASNGAGGSCGVYQSQIHAFYFPTSYGPVQTLDFGAADAQPSPGAASQVQSTDLRDLEMNALRARVQAEQAERQLMEAQMAKQNATEQR